MTGLIIAIVVVVLIAVAIVVLMPRMRAAKLEKKRRAELDRRRDVVTEHHRDEAATKTDRAARVETEAQQARAAADAAEKKATAERAEAEVHQQRADLHAEGRVPEEELHAEHDRIAGTSSDEASAPGRVADRDRGAHDRPAGHDDRDRPREEPWTDPPPRR